MRIYLAARYSRRAEMLEIAKYLQACGIEITSRWVGGTHEGTLDQPKPWADFAREDVADLWNADAILAFSEDPHEATVRGGRHVEFGMALAWGKQMYVVGPQENIFHYLPQVQHFKTVREFVETVIGHGAAA